MKGCQVASRHAPVIQVSVFIEGFAAHIPMAAPPQQRNEVLPPCSIPQTARTCKVSENITYVVVVVGFANPAGGGGNGEVQ